MSDFEMSGPTEKHPLLLLVLFILVVFLAFGIVGPMIGFVFAMPFYNGSMTELVEAIQFPATHPDVKLPIYIVQGFATFIGLIVAPVWFLKANHKSVASLLRNDKLRLSPVITTAVLVVVFMGVNSIFIEWNANAHFPEFLKGFEEWAREKEDLATELTQYLTKFDSVFEVAIALLVIAVLPAIGEEIAFRGIVQNLLRKLTGNIHVSIWVAAFLFSAIHLQFFGFVPRLLLGALFGYLYYWSGSLKLAMVAHFVNNGFSVIAMYFYQRGTVPIDLENPESLPLSAVAVSAVVSAGLLFYIYNYFRNFKSDVNPL
jgi:uncharacterized protein